MTHSTPDYRRDAYISYAGVAYECHVCIGPTWRQERLDPDRYRKPRSDPTAYAKQLGMIHFAIGPRLLADFYNTLSAIICPGEAGIVKRSQLWTPGGVWTPTPAVANDVVLRAECTLYPRAHLPFAEVVEAFVRAERAQRRGYKCNYVDIG